MSRIQRNSGYSLVEMIVVIIIVAIIATVSIKSLGKVTVSSRVEETRRELDRLAHAMVGDPDLVSGGGRVDYGYVGDVGALPLNLDGLANNPGGWSSWDGPYLLDEFSSGSPDTNFKIDAWGQAYNYAASNAISSTGGPAIITRSLAPSVDDLLYNQISLSVADLDKSPPGDGYMDSISVALTYPNGLGGFANRTRSPDRGGFLAFDSIPIGVHELRMIYHPDNDTTLRKVNVGPGQELYVELVINRNFW